MRSKILAISIVALCFIGCSAQKGNKPRVWIDALLIPNQIEVPVYCNANRSRITYYIKNDTVSENYYELSLGEIKNDMFKVKTVPSLPINGEFEKPKTGWIERKNVGIYLRAQDTVGIYPIYDSPDRKLVYHEIINRSNKLVNILDFCKGWIKVMMIIKGKKEEGWIPEEYFCANAYTTCN